MSAKAMRAAPAPEGRQYERPVDVLRRVRVGRSTLYEWIWSGQIPSVKVGRSVLIPAGAVDEFLANQASAAKTRFEG